MLSQHRLRLPPKMVIALPGRHTAKPFVIRLVRVQSQLAQVRPVRYRPHLK